MGIRNVDVGNFIFYSTSNIYKKFIEAITILNGSVISSPLESRIEISVLFDDFMVTNDLIPFHSAAVFFLFFFEILFIIV